MLNKEVCKKCYGTYCVGIISTKLVDKFEEKWAKGIVHCVHKPIYISSNFNMAIHLSLLKNGVLIN